MRSRARIVRNNRYQTWNALWTDESGSHSIKLGDFSSLPDKTDATNRAIELGFRVSDRLLPTVSNLLDGFRRDRMPERFSARYSTEQWINNRIVPKWGTSLITDVQGPSCGAMAQGARPGSR